MAYALNARDQKAKSENKKYKTLEYIVINKTFNYLVHAFIGNLSCVHATSLGKWADYCTFYLITSTSKTTYMDLKLLNRLFNHFKKKFIDLNFKHVLGISFSESLIMFRSLFVEILLKPCMALR